MKNLVLLLPLVALCSNLLLLHPSSSAAYPTPTLTPTTQSEQIQPQQPPSSIRPYKLIYHPPTKSCIASTSGNTPLKLGPCEAADARWEYSPQGILFARGTYFCIQPVDAGKPPRLGVVCDAGNSSWKQVAVSDGSGGKTRLESVVRGKAVCLDAGTNGDVDTNPCLVGGGAGESQWFEITTVGNKE